MKRVVFSIIALCFFAPVLNAQIAEPTVLCPLPAVLFESSGIEIHHSNSIWTHNDSGDSARIFNIDTAGNILRIINFDIHPATDCEESTRDSMGNYYLGDFGNNTNDRTNLRIYKITNPDTTSADTIEPEIISFHYADQTMFPPDSSQRNFDCEAMFHYHDSLYLFSKNRGTSTFTRLYRLPDQAGDYVAELVDSFNTGAWVTSADISPSGKNMVLLSESQIWLFKNISGADFFGGDAQLISMTTTQKEAIVFVNDSLLYITDEYFWGYGGNLYKLELSSWLNSTETIPITNVFTVYPNPSSGKVFINFPDNNNTYDLFITDMTGKTLFSAENQNNLIISNLLPGTYIVRVETPDRQSKSTILIVY